MCMFMCKCNSLSHMFINPSVEFKQTNLQNEVQLKKIYILKNTITSYIKSDKRHL